MIKNIGNIDQFYQWQVVKVWQYGESAATIAATTATTINQLISYQPKNP